MASRSARWFRLRVLQLLNADTRLRRAMDALIPKEEVAADV